MNKKAEFLKLVQDVSECHVCEHMITNPHSDNGECLLNDEHGLNTDKPYVNLWNLWNGNLDADIMVIGQDFGTKEEAEHLQNEWKAGTYSNHTDRNIRDLFEKVFSIDVDSDRAPLFFTNMANCYRRNISTGEMHSGWLPICANKFMGRLIEIIMPKVIIVLGQKTFEAFFCIEGHPIRCVSNNSQGNSFSDIVSASYQIEFGNKAIDVFPVYHPGAYSQRNRKFNEQVSDWKRIKKCLDERIKNG